MPRRSSRAVPASPAPAPKRRASGRLSTASQTEPKRQKSNTTTARPVRSTQKKSKYFEDKSSESDSASDHEEDPTSDYDGHGTSPDVASDESAINQTTVKSNGGVESETAVLEGKQLWKEGVKAGLGPGKEVFIQKPKAREPGNVPYKDDTLHPNTFLFLQDLTENNERAWLKAHDPDYRASKRDWETWVETFSEHIMEVDSTIPELPAKDLVFRIHRDIRFSKNPTPYKTHFSAACQERMPPMGIFICGPGPSSKPCVSLLQQLLDPTTSLYDIDHDVGAGIWQPEADRLALIREDIDRNSHGLKAVLNEEGIRREFFNGIPDNEEQAVKAFVNQNKESALKTRPKGYDHDNENIQLLRLRSFTIGKALSDGELLSPDAQTRIAPLIGILEIFVSYLP
ncbi:hypothetical protein FE257_001244 [Aspergillus nanangensis]|uniref:Uncharacterized protein n=1 Tax=Aspergillus nanangensis TaxID=2582783 RepID=A0AAD4CE11_ASPNN|nr:hypothetical protein FE257_001244 [Aspergillus nanangensis]